MGLSCGIVGLPNVGKSTIFNALTKAGAQSANYPFCTIEPNVGVVAVPDKRMDVLVKIADPDKKVPTAIEFLDIAGLVKGASKGEGLGNQFLGHIRQVDAILHIVRCFDDDNIVHVEGSSNPKRDVEIINTELLLADMDTVEKRLLRSQKGAKSGDKKAKAETDLLTRLGNSLSNGIPARMAETNDEEAEILAGLHLLTSKPVLYVGNIAEKDIKNGNPYLCELEKIAQSEGAGIISICGAVESEIIDFSDEEKIEFLHSIGADSTGLEKLINASYSLLHLITYFTVGKKEVRAWTVTRGTKAPQAAGVIHSDFEKGFIRAEVIGYDDFVNSNGEQGAKEKGLMRLEGKEYAVKDGDIMHFRFNV